MYTSLKLAKLLAANGCELESDHRWVERAGDIVLEPCSFETLKEHYPAYDMLNDLCVKYAKEVFGVGMVEIEYSDEALSGWHDADVSETTYIGGKLSYPYYEGANLKITIQALAHYSFSVIALLQQGKTEEAEEYLWAHCLFNPKNQ